LKGDFKYFLTEEGLKTKWRPAGDNGKVRGWGSKGQSKRKKKRAVVHFQREDGRETSKQKKGKKKDAAAYPYDGQVFNWKEEGLLDRGGGIRVGSNVCPLVRKMKINPGRTN